MRNQGTAESEAAFNQVTHYTPSQCRPEKDQAQRSSALLLPPFPVLGLTPKLLKGKWKKLKC